MEIGDRISAKIFSFTTLQDPSMPSSPDDNYHQLYFNSNIDFDVKEQIGGEFIDFSVIMPETSQIDFVKDVMQRYGLMYTQDRNSNHFKFIRFEKLLNEIQKLQGPAPGMYDFDVLEQFLYSLFLFL